MTGIAVSRVAATPPRPAGRVFAFIGAKGGVGTTTLAVNAASALGAPGRRALLVDLHDGDGDAAAFLNARPARTLADACENAHRLDERYLRGLVHPVGRGIDLLAAPEGTRAYAFDAARLRTVLQRAAACYAYVILDTSRGCVPLLESVDVLASVFVVTNQDFVSLKRGRRLAEGLKAWRRHVRLSAVVNRFDDAGDIGERDIERVLGLAITQIIPHDHERVHAAIGRGRPVVGADRSELADALVALAAHLSGAPGAPQPGLPAHGAVLQALAPAG